MERLTLGSVLLFAELLIAGAAIPLIRRRVARNRWYGLRTAATLADDHTWYEANAIAGWGLLGVGLLNGTFTIGWLARVPGSSLPVLLLVLFATPLLTLVVCSIAARRLRRRQLEAAIR